MLLSEEISSEEVYLSAHFKKFLFSVETVYDKKPLKLCDSISPITSGIDCPSSGTYDFIVNFPLPVIKGFLIGWKLNTIVKIYDKDDNELGHFEAELPTHSDTSNNASLHEYLTVFGSLAILGGLGCVARRKFRSATVEEEKANASDFIMMPDKIEMSRMSHGDSVFV